MDARGWKGRELAIAAVALLLCAGVAAAIAVGHSTPANRFGLAAPGLSACATATAPAHTVAVDGNPVATIPGTTVTNCTTTTQTTTTAPTTAPTTTTTPAPGYVFDDEFNGAAGSLPSSSLWDYKTFNGGNAKWGGTTKVSENGSGDLAIDATCSSACTTATNWTSGFISGKVALTGSYRIEARSKIPCGQGVWPAPVWTWGYPYGAAPSIENDVIEQLGSGQATSYHTTLHNWNGSTNPQLGHQDAVGVTLCNAFHTYASNVYADRIDYLFGGAKIDSITAAQVGLANFATQKQVANIDLDMGGWAGTIGATSTQTMLVDYIRVTPL